MIYQYLQPKKLLSIFSISFSTVIFGVPTQAQSLSNLSNGNYSYLAPPPASPSQPMPSLHFHKSGNIIVGSTLVDQQGTHCFRGVVNQNRIDQITVLTQTFLLNPAIPKTNFDENAVAFGIIDPVRDEDVDSSIHWILRTLQERYPVKQASGDGLEKINECVNGFRPLVNTGINLRMTYENVRNQLLSRQWQKGYNSVNPQYRNYDEVRCYPNNFCLGFFSKGSQTMEVSFSRTGSDYRQHRVESIIIR